LGKELYSDFDLKNVLQKTNIEPISSTTKKDNYVK